MLDAFAGVAKVDEATWPRKLIRRVKNTKTVDKILDTLEQRSPVQSMLPTSEKKGTWVFSYTRANRYTCHYDVPTWTFVPEDPLPAGERRSPSCQQQKIDSSAESTTTVSKSA